VSIRPGRLRVGRRGRRLGDLGHDHEHGHLTYVEQLDAGGRAWLRTKPFSAPPNEELVRCLRTFAHVVDLLQLGLRAQVLDVGCGPGWLSEFLARCGYWVTGIDISPDMVEIARERVTAIPQLADGVEPLAEFHAMRVTEMPWSSRFDAAILYDTMHHFDDELETLEVIRRTLVPGGQLFIHEGVLPPPGSEAERNLLAEMERFGTLESPFEPEYLAEIVNRAGFTRVRRLAEHDELVDLGLEKPFVAKLRERLSMRQTRPDFNVVHAINPIPEARAGEGSAFAAELGARGGWRADAGELALTVTVVNAGRAFWPAGLRHPFPHGSVTLGPYVRGPQGERALELPRTTLPRSLSPGESVTLEVRVPRESAPAGHTLAVEAVREGVFWFSEVGSEALVVPVAAS
jgi:SAM-dependent methyltransferase